MKYFYANKKVHISFLDETDLTLSWINSLFPVISQFAKIILYKSVFPQSVLLLNKLNKCSISKF